MMKGGWQLQSLNNPCEHQTGFQYVVDSLDFEDLRRPGGAHLRWCMRLFVSLELARCFP